jgi:hypothetical protein
MRQGPRALWLNNHDNNTSFDAKYFIVLDPKTFKEEEEAPEYNELSYFDIPYVRSKDWKNHEVKQEYAFRHPKEGEYGRRGWRQLDGNQFREGGDGKRPLGMRGPVGLSKWCKVKGRRG